MPHAFTTRRGGFSTGPFASLNFGNPSDLTPDRRDPPTNIHANLGLVLGAIEAPGREIVQMHQVHGGDVKAVRPRHPSHDGPTQTRADGIVTNDPARALAVRVADCAPVLLTSTDGYVVGAVHAGWRGVIAGVVPAAVAAMREMGADEIVAAIGPCIGTSCFQVGPEVAAEFRSAFGPTTRHVLPDPDTSDRSLVDLKGALREQLLKAGVAGVDVLPHCTVTSEDEESGAPLFFSHRRDNGLTGRMIGIIGPRGR